MTLPGLLDGVLLGGEAGAFVGSGLLAVGPSLLEGAPERSGRLQDGRGPLPEGFGQPEEGRPLLTHGKRAAEGMGIPTPSLAAHLHGDGSDLGLRLSIEDGGADQGLFALGFGQRLVVGALQGLGGLDGEAAAIEAEVQTDLLQGVVGVGLPGGAQVADALGGGEGAVLPGGETVGLRRIERAVGEHDVGVRLGLTVQGMGGMDGQVGDDAPGGEPLADEGADELDLLLGAELAGQGHEDLAGGDGIAPLLGGVEVIPEPLPLTPPVRCLVWSDDLGMDDTALAAVVVDQSLALIEQGVAMAVGGCGDDGPPLSPADRSCLDPIDRHADGPPRKRPR